MGKTRNRENIENFLAAFIGALTASVISFIKSFGGIDWGIPLPLCLCLVSPILGGTMGSVISAKLINKIYKDEKGAWVICFFGGILGGLIVGLITNPIPWISMP